MDLMRLRQRSQMADGPRDHVPVAVEIAVALSGRAQNARNITRNRRLFRDHGGATGVGSLRSA